GGTMTDAGITKVSGTLASEGTGTVFLASGRVLENSGTVELRSERTISSSGTLGVLRNTGTVTGVGTLAVPVENDGTLSGAITLSGGDGPGTSSGVFSDGVRFTSQTFELDGATLNGTQIAGGTVNVAAATATGANTLASGTLGGTGTFTVSGTLTWTGG